MGECSYGRHSQQNTSINLNHLKAESCGQFSQQVVAAGPVAPRQTTMGRIKFGAELTSRRSAVEWKCWKKGHNANCCPHYKRRTLWSFGNIQGHATAVIMYVASDCVSCHWCLTVKGALFLSAAQSNSFECNKRSEGLCIEVPFLINPFWIIWNTTANFLPIRLTPRRDLQRG